MRRELGMFVALVLLCLGLWASNHDFLGASNVINTTRQISMLGVFAIGISFVIITGGIDLSIGSVIGLTGVLIAKLSGQYYPDNPASGGLGYSLWVGIPAALAVSALIGLAQGLLITRLRLQPFIVTLGGMLLLRGVSQTVVRGGTLSLGDIPLVALANGGLFGSEGSPLLPYPFLILLLVAAVAAYLLHFTVFGRYVYAIGGNRDAAEYSGIPVRRVETLTYVISAFSGGVAGVCYAIRAHLPKPLHDALSGVAPSPASTSCVASRNTASSVASAPCNSPRRWPSRITRMRSASASTSGKSLETIRHAMPVSASRRMRL